MLVPVHDGKEFSVLRLNVIVPSTCYSYYPTLQYANITLYGEGPNEELSFVCAVGSWITFNNRDDYNFTLSRVAVNDVIYYTRHQSKIMPLAANGLELNNTMQISEKLADSLGSNIYQLYSPTYNSTFLDLMPRSSNVTETFEELNKKGFLGVFFIVRDSAYKNTIDFDIANLDSFCVFIVCRSNWVTQLIMRKNNIIYFKDKLYYNQQHRICINVPEDQKSCLPKDTFFFDKDSL